MTYVHSNAFYLKSLNQSKGDKFQHFTMQTCLMYSNACSYVHHIYCWFNGWLNRLSAILKNFLITAVRPLTSISGFTNSTSCILQLVQATDSFYTLANCGEQLIRLSAFLVTIITQTFHLTGGLEPTYNSGGQQTESNWNNNVNYVLKKILDKQ